MTIPTRHFRPFERFTYRMALTNSSSNINIDPDPSPRNGLTEEFRVYNNGSVVIYVRFGVDSTVTAVIPTAGTGSGVAPGDIPIAPGGTFIFRGAPEITWMAGICGTTADVYVVPGRGG